jgi:spermidine synthase
MKIELLHDATRETGRWLMVDGSEQSYVDLADPLHLEFEYVQMMAYVLQVVYGGNAPLVALHLGGGLCTVPRWLAATHPGSEQRVVEHSRDIARLARSLGPADGVRIVVGDAFAKLVKTRAASVDLIVCDVYDGPETVTEAFTVPNLMLARRVLRPAGLYLCNLSDATPFALSQVAAAGLREIFSTVVLLAEPAVLRGRRSGNLVLAATDHAFPLAALVRRAAGGMVQARVLAGHDLATFVGDAKPARAAGDVPASGESADSVVVRLTTKR